MDFRGFHNALRVLRSLDRHEIAPALSYEDWFDFRDFPYDWFIGAEESKARAVWAAVERRAGAVEADGLPLVYEARLSGDGLNAARIPGLLDMQGEFILTVRRAGKI